MNGVHDARDLPAITKDVEFHDSDGGTEWEEWSATTTFHGGEWVVVPSGIQVDTLDAYTARAIGMLLIAAAGEADRLNDEIAAKESAELAEEAKC